MERSESPFRVVVCDAGPVIHLDELECLDLLNEFREVLIPTVVWSEVQRHRPSALEHQDVRFKRIYPVLRSSPEVEAASKTFHLHEGERQALIVAKRYPADLLLTDDSAARLACQSVGVPVHGTIGILIRSIRQGRKTREEVSLLLRELPSKSTLYLKSDLLGEIIRQIES